MVRIRHEKGGQGIGPHWWPEDDPVCDVPEELARDLLANPWGYSVEPDPAQGEPEPAGEGNDGEQGPEKPAPRRRKGTGTSQALPALSS